MSQDKLSLGDVGGGHVLSPKEQQIIDWHAEKLCQDMQQWRINKFAPADPKKNPPLSDCEALQNVLVAGYYELMHAIVYTHKIKTEALAKRDWGSVDDANKARRHGQAWIAKKIMGYIEVCADIKTMNFDKATRDKIVTGFTGSIIRTAVDTAVELDVFADVDERLLGFTREDISALRTRK